MERIQQKREKFLPPTLYSFSFEKPIDKTLNLRVLGIALGAKNGFWITIPFLRILSDKNVNIS